jgi:hypothetical protein
MLSFLLYGCVQTLHNEQKWLYDSVIISRCGILTEEQNGQLVIKKIYSNTPAEKVGLLTGDVILTINGKKLTRKEYVSMMDNWEPEQPILLNVNRNGQILDFRIQPVTVQVPLVSRKIQELLDDNKHIVMAIIVTRVENKSSSETLDYRANERWVESIKSTLLSDKERFYLKDFDHHGNFIIVDHGSIDSIIKKMTFSADFASDESRNKFGRLTGATHVLLLHFSRFPEGDVISQRLIDVETGKVLTIEVDRSE